MCWWGVSTKHAMLSSCRHHVPCPLEIEYGFFFISLPKIQEMSRQGNVL